jgi:hypothetical protein
MEEAMTFRIKFGIVASAGIALATDFSLQGQQKGQYVPGLGSKVLMPA